MFFRYNKQLIYGVLGLFTYNNIMKLLCIGFFIFVNLINANGIDNIEFVEGDRSSYSLPPGINLDGTFDDSKVADFQPKEYALLEKGQALYKQARYTDVINTLLPALETDKDNVEINYLISYSYMKLNNNVEALTYMNHAMEISPTNAQILRALALIYKNLNNDVSSKQYINLVINSPSVSSSDYVFRGDLFASLPKGRSDRAALVDYLSAIRLDPNNVQANYKAGMMYLSLGDKQKASQYFLSAMEIGGPTVAIWNGLIKTESNPNKIKMYRANIQNILALEKYNKGDYKDAIALYKSAYNEFPSGKIDAMIGMVYLAQKDNKSAKKSFKKAIKQEPLEVAVAYYQLFKMSKKNTDLFLHAYLNRSYELYIAAKPEYARAYLLEAYKIDKQDADSIVEKFPPEFLESLSKGDVVPLNTVLSYDKKYWNSPSPISLVYVEKTKAKGAGDSFFNFITKITSW